MNATLPPVCTVDRLSLELRLGPHASRAVAVEGWLAFLSGHDPARAVNTYARRERRLRRRMISAIRPELN